MYSQWCWWPGYPGCVWWHRYPASGSGRLDIKIGGRIRFGPLCCPGYEDWGLSCGLNIQAGSLVPGYPDWNLGGLESSLGLYYLDANLWIWWTVDWYPD
jgi:hypothetical protein